MKNSTRFCFPAAILDFQLKTTSGDRTIESGTPEKIGIAVGISFLAHSYADIKYFRFGGRHLGFAKNLKIIYITKFSITISYYKS